jgi:hypothetical protein
MRASKVVGFTPISSVLCKNQDVSVQLGFEPHLTCSGPRPDNHGCLARKDDKNATNPRQLSFYALKGLGAYYSMLMLLMTLFFQSDVAKIIVVDFASVYNWERND